MICAALPSLVTDFPVCIELTIWLAAPGGRGAGGLKPEPTNLLVKFSVRAIVGQTNGATQLRTELPVIWLKISSASAKIAEPRTAATALGVRM
jgi:hypothetical protein